jgi:hypothetical protein
MRSTMKRSVLIAILTVITIAAPPSAPVAHAQSIFNVVKTPNPNPNGFENALTSISGSSTSDIWAVGQSVMHFNGQKWEAFSAPDINGSGVNELQSVVDISPSNVWAVGYVNLDEDNPGQLIEHYDGNAWSIDPGPPIPSGDVAYLEAVTGTSATDIWATGSVLIDNGAVFFPLFEHYDGTSWTASIEGFANSFMFGISADSPSDIWAVGTGNGANHYDGNSWNAVPMSIPGVGENALLGVAALTPNDAWAVGFYVEGQDQSRPRITLIEQWNGSEWNVVPSPNPGGSANSNVLYGITAISTNDIWAYGSSLDIASDLESTLVLHWDGNSWSVIPSPDTPTARPNTHFLQGGTVLPTGDLWLVGGYGFLKSYALNATGQ